MQISHCIVSSHSASSLIYERLGQLRRGDHGNERARMYVSPFPSLQLPPKPLQFLIPYGKINLLCPQTLLSSIEFLEEDTSQSVSMDGRLWSVVGLTCLKSDFSFESASRSSFIRLSSCAASARPFDLGEGGGGLSGSVSDDRTMTSSGTRSV